MLAGGACTCGAVDSRELRGVVTVAREARSIEYVCTCICCFGLSRYKSTVISVSPSYTDWGYGLFAVLVLSPIGPEGRVGGV